MRQRKRALLLSFAWALMSKVGAAAPPDGRHPGAEEQSCSAAHIRAQVLRRDTPEKLLERRTALRTCSSAACPRSISEACTAWSRDVDALMPNLTVRVVDSHGVAVSDASIRIDGTAQVMGTPVDVDPGEHTVIVVTATTESHTVVLRPGEKGRALEIVMRSDRSSSPVAPAAASTAAVPGSSEATAVPAGAWALFGLGAAAAIAGGTLAVMAQGYKTDASCPNHNCRSESDADSRNRRVFGFSLAAGIGFSVAAIAIGVGATWTLLRDRAQSPRASRVSSPRKSVEWILGFGWGGVRGEFR